MFFLFLSEGYLTMSPLGVALEKTRSNSSLDASDSGSQKKDGYIHMAPIRDHYSSSVSSGGPYEGYLDMASLPSSGGPYEGYLDMAPLPSSLPKTLSGNHWFFAYYYRFVIFNIVAK